MQVKRNGYLNIVEKINNSYKRTPKHKFSNWENESKVLRALNINHSLENGVLIREWFQGEIIKKWDNKVLKKLNIEIEKLHKLSIPEITKHDWSIYDHNSKFVNPLVFSKFIELRKKYKDSNLVVSHNDINKENVLKHDDQIKLIDFEWANLNHEYFDYVQFYITEGIALKYSPEDKVFKDIEFLTIIFFLLWTFDAPQEEKILLLRSQYKDKIDQFVF